MPVSLLSRRLRRQSGQAIPVIAVLLVVLIGMAGLVTDGGQLTIQYRASQNAADAGALAAATKLTNGGSETQATAAADLIATNNQVPAADLSVSYYDSTGAATTNASAVTQVTAVVTHNFPTLFLPIVGIDSARVAATASVTVTQGSQDCVFCVMDASASSALGLGGNGSLAVNGGNIEVNSTSGSAISVGPNGTITDTGGSVYVVGGASGANHITPAPVTGATAAADPLASIAVPSVSTTGTCCSSPLNPGVYSSISISGNSNVTMNPGVYVVTGSISLAGNSTLTGHSVMIYLACSNYPTPCTSGQSGASLSVAGNGQVNLSAPATGTYQGLTIFSDRNNKSTIDFGGNGSTRFVGTIYDLSGTLDLHGNGSNSSMNSRVVSKDVSIVGNSTVTISYTQSANYVIPNTLTLTN